jgi:hypothetical protein
MKIIHMNDDDDWCELKYPDPDRIATLYGQLMSSLIKDITRVTVFLVKEYV